MSAGPKSGLPVPRLRQPQARSGQCAWRPDARPRGDLRLYPLRLAGRDHGGVGQLAAHPRLGRIGGVGLPLAAVRTAHGGGDTQGQNQLVPLYDLGDSNAAVIARLQAGVLATVKRCTGNWCRLVGPGFDGWAVQEQLWGVYPNGGRWNSSPGCAGRSRQYALARFVRRHRSDPSADGSHFDPNMTERRQANVLNRRTELCPKASALKSAAQRPLRSLTTTSMRATLVAFGRDRRLADHHVGVGDVEQTRSRPRRRSGDAGTTLVSK